MIGVEDITLKSIHANAKGKYYVLKIHSLLIMEFNKDLEIKFLGLSKVLYKYHGSCVNFSTFFSMPSFSRDKPVRLHYVTRFQHKTETAY